MKIKPILQPYVPIADMLSQTFGEDCEVVIHDLSTPERSVVYVANNRVTGREPGQSFDHLITQVLFSEKLKDEYVANYYFTARNGKRIRSSTLLIREKDGTLAGAMCINLDTTRITQQMEFLRSMLPAGMEAEAAMADLRVTEQPGHVADIVDGLIRNIIGSKPSSEMSREERIEKIRFMEEKGIFLMKGSVDKVAAYLNMNRVTVYSYLDEIRGKRK